ncbi:MAG: hypothetical protein LKF43_10540 [Streptococcaceae bacterium]|nr:hypothetical protein [Streptococcaceae bacterium]
MDFLSKQRMNLYKLVMVLYVLIINVLFYSSGNLLVIIMSTIANILVVLTILGFVSFNNSRKREKIKREQKRAARKDKANL